MIHNNNVILELAKAENKKNKKCIILITIAIALAIIAIFSIFILLLGKVKIDSLKTIRKDGTVASGKLTSATEEQYIELKELDYIEKIGKTKEIGTWVYNDKVIAYILVSDKMTFQDFFQPAYTDIVGDYPTESDEIMISLSTLNKLGIKNPQIGMSVSLSILWNDWTKNEVIPTEYEMKLSGYYTEYTESTSNVFFELKEEDYLMDLHFIVKDSLYSRDEIETKLYSDISIGEQQKIIGMDSVISDSLEKTIGGYGIAALCGIILLLSEFLLIFNLLSISASSHAAREKIMRTLGMTERQLKKMIRIQNMRIICPGCCVGLLLTFGMGIWFYPTIMEKLYLKGIGSIDNKYVFSWKVCVVVVLVVILMSWIAANKSNMVFRLKYSKKNGFYVKKRSERRKHKGIDHFYILKLAWYNITRVSKKFWLTIISITMVSIVMVCSIVISKGVDLENQLELNPDFCISVTSDAIQAYQFEWEEQKRENFYFISDVMIEDIVKIAGIYKDDVQLVKGSIGSFDFTEEAVRPLVNANSGDIRTNTDVIIQCVDKETLNTIIEYANEFNKKIDSNSLRSENGALVLHNHMLSNQQEIKADQQIGKSIHITDLNMERTTELSCSGYIDITDKYFPNIDMTWNDQYVNYFMLSEETFKNMEMNDFIFNISFNVEEKNEAVIKEKLRLFIQEENNNSEIKPYELTANSDVLQENADYLTVSRIIMGMVSVVLLFVALMNYTNTLITEILARDYEFALMESIGMNQKQIKIMIIFEGLCYSLVSICGLVSIGTIIIYIIVNFISKRLDYFVFYNPLKEIIALIFLLTLLCVVLPVVLYKSISKKNNIERIKEL